MKSKTESERNHFVVEVEPDRPALLVGAKEVVKPRELKPVGPILPDVETRKTITPAVEAKKRHIQWGMYWAGMGTMLLLVGLAGGIWWKYGQEWSLPQGVSLPPSPTPVAQAPLLPKIEPVIVDRSFIAVDVFNASGVRGKASEIAAEIQKLGYKRGTVGNALLQKGSTLAMSQDVATMSALVLTDLEPIVTGVTLVETPLPGTNSMRLLLGTE